MKEIGHSEAKRAVVLCTNLTCSLNHIDIQHISKEEALAQGKKHDALERHEAVVVEYDGDYPLANGDRYKALDLTGVLIH